MVRGAHWCKAVISVWAVLPAVALAARALERLYRLFRLQALAPVVITAGAHEKIGRIVAEQGFEIGTTGDLCQRRVGFQYLSVRGDAIESDRHIFENRPQPLRGGARTFALPTAVDRELNCR